MTGRLQAVPHTKTLTALLCALFLAGCASVNFDDSVSKANQDAAAFTQGKLALAQTQAQRADQALQAAKYLAQPLGQAEAVQLALVNSPALQSMLAQNWADAATAAQVGRIFNPTLTLERTTMLDEVEIGRSLSFGLLDLLTLPQRMGIAERGIARAQVQLTADVVDQVTQVRQAWVKAVAAQQYLVYAQQVSDAAQASADLARRMQAVGNFSKLQRARQQVFYAEAATQRAGAQHDATATREALVRALGLDDAQAGHAPRTMTGCPAGPDLEIFALGELARGDGETGTERAGAVPVPGNGGGQFGAQGRPRIAHGHRRRVVVRGAFGDALQAVQPGPVDPAQAALETGTRGRLAQDQTPTPGAPWAPRAAAEPQTGGDLSGGEAIGPGDRYKGAQAARRRATGGHGAPPTAGPLRVAAAATDSLRGVGSALGAPALGV